MPGKIPVETFPNLARCRRMSFKQVILTIVRDRLTY